MAGPQMKMNPNQNKVAFKDDPEYYEICTSVIPTISDVIDEKGGFCALVQLAEDPRVQQVLATIPPHYPSKVKTVIELFPDFISFFQGGRVATAKGYEQGLVNADGTVNAQPKKSNDRRGKKEKNGENGEVPEGAPMNGMNPNENQNQNPTKGPTQQNNQVLSEIAKRLKAACHTATDQQFHAIYEEACAARRGMRFRPQYTGASKQDCIQIIAEKINLLLSKQALPRVSVLAAMPEIQALRSSMEPKKLIPFLDANPECFIVDRPEGTAQNMTVTLHPSFVPCAPTHMMQQEQQQFTHGFAPQQQMNGQAPNGQHQPGPKGKGKGKKGKGKGFNQEDSAAKRAKIE